MTLQSPRLDDLTWDAMTEAARRRIPAESGGVWTLHAPIDPGVTLLELLAYLLEQRLYWLDQVPDALVVAVLRLMGLDGPLPARAAATVLRLSVESTADGTTLVPASTVLSRDPLERITFSLDEDVAVLPLDPDGLSLWVGDRDRTADLLARRGVPVLSAAGGADEFRIELRPATGSDRPPRGTWLSLLVELDSAGQCPPSWSPDAVGDVAPPAAVSWSWYRPGGPPVPSPSEVDDGTAGLRRSGIVRLRLPDKWCEGAPGTPPDVYGFRVRTASATFSAPPVLLQLAPNAGAARHREARTVTDADLADQLRGWLRLPGQHLTLPDARGLLLDASVRVRRRGETTDWQPVPDLTFGGPADRIFVLDREAGAVRFGDGLTGAIPVPDAPTGDGPTVTVDYWRGGGIAGNGGQTANWFAVGGSGSGVIVTARNVVPAEGGRDAETVTQARRRAGEELGRVHRAVTAEDFAELAETTPGVAVGRSYVGVGEHPGYPCTPVPGAVTVRVLPAVRREPEQFEAVEFAAALRPDPGLLHEVTEHLAKARLVGTEIFVCPPRYRRAGLRVTVGGPLADPASARTAVRAALRRYLDPLLGGDDGQGWPFGGPVRPSALLRVAQEALGDAVEVTRVAIGLDGAPPDEDCDDVALRPGELVALEQTVLMGASGS